MAPGYDVLLDCHMRPHLLEVNSRPSIYTEPLDLAVNAPLVRELFSLVGFHLPSCGMSQSTLKVACLGKKLNLLYQSTQELCKRYKLSPEMAARSTFFEELYTRDLCKEVRVKKQNDVLTKGEN